MQYNYSYNVCALAIAMLCLWFLIFRKDMRRKNSQLFLAVLICEVLTCVFNIWGAVLNNTPGPAVPVLEQTVDALYLLFHSFTICMFGWYFINFMGLRHKMHAATQYIYILPFLCLQVIPMAIPQTLRLIFHFSENGEYVQGPLMFWTVYLTGYIYSALIIAMIFIHRDRLSNEQMTACLFLMWLGIASIVIQQFFLPDQLINEFFISLGVALILLSLDNQNWVYNFITHSYNRQTFHRHLQSDFENHTHFKVVAVSISRTDYLKSLMLEQDTFQGLMMEIASYLKGLKNRLNIYYCETGEFAIPVYDDSHWDAKTLAETIAERFRGTWGEDGYRFAVRITEISIPQDADSFVKLQKIIDIPYESVSEDPKIIDADTLLNMSESGDASDSSPERGSLPEDLELLLDSFSHNIEELTPAERSIVLYYLEGYDISDIPDLAGISINTVRKHNKNIYRKLEISSKEELMLYLDLLDRCNMLEPIEESLRAGQESETA